MYCIGRITNQHNFAHDILMPLTDDLVLAQRVFRMAGTIGGNAF